MATSVTETLRRASEGLLYISEQDAPFEAFAWRDKGDLTNEKLLALGKHPAGTSVREMAFDEFFADLVKEEDWHEEEEKATVAKYRDLVKVLKAQLTDLKVFRVGARDVTIYVVGRTPAGTWAGVKTAAVET